MTSRSPSCMRRLNKKPGFRNSWGTGQAGTIAVKGGPTRPMWASSLTPDRVNSVGTSGQKTRNDARTHIFHIEARCDAAKSDRGDQRPDRKGGAAHRRAKTRPDDPRASGDFLRDP